MICSIFLTLVLVGILVGLFYISLVWNYDHWKKRGVKGPKPTIIYGSFPNMIKQKKNFIYDIQDIYKQYHLDEDFLGVYNMCSPQLLILSPELARAIFVTEFKSFHDNEACNWFDEKTDKIMSNNPFTLRGDEWKERRQEVIGGLTPTRVKATYPVTKEVCNRLIDYMKRKCILTDGNGIDGKDLCLRYTSEVTSDCVLGIKAESFTDNPTPILRMIKTLTEQTNSFILYSIVVGLWPIIRSFYKARFFRKETETFFFDLMRSTFDMRRKSKLNRMDFMDYILQLQEKKNLSNDQLAAHTMTFLLDGFETTASVITNCLYQLAKNPRTQEKLRKEILNNVNDIGEIEFEKLLELPYLDQCIHESIRVIPPVMFAMRLCTEKCELPNRNGKKAQLKPNDVALIPIYALHHDEQFFPNPNEFLPERFDPENGGVKKYRDMGVFFPFGDGPRICLGMKFALTQSKAALVDIVRTFKVSLNPKTRTDNVIDKMNFIGALEGGVWLDFEEIQ